MDEAWCFEHAIGCKVCKEFAWNFWKVVDNWKLDADIESVELNGPFSADSCGVTSTRSSGRIEWRIVRVTTKREAVLDVPLAGATGRFR